MLDKLIDLGYDIHPFLENHVLAVKDDIEIFLDSESGTYTARNTKYNSHEKIPSDTLTVLREFKYKSTKVHKNMTGQD